MVRNFRAKSAVGLVVGLVVLILGYQNCADQYLAPANENSNSLGSADSGSDPSGNGGGVPDPSLDPNQQPNGPAQPGPIVPNGNYSATPNPVEYSGSVNIVAYNLFNGPLAKPEVMEPLLYQQFKGTRLLVNSIDEVLCMNIDHYRLFSNGMRSVANIICGNISPGSTIQATKPGGLGPVNPALISYTYPGLKAQFRSSFGTRCFHHFTKTSTTGDMKQEYVAEAVCELPGLRADIVKEVEMQYLSFNGSTFPFVYRVPDGSGNTGSYVDRTGTATVSNLNYTCKQATDWKNVSLKPRANVWYLMCTSPATVDLKI